MSPGDQLISILIDAIGFFIEALISTFIDLILDPFIQALFGG